ncbi:MAG: DUF1707 SHOCT-like domain-containing protein [Streptosporangiaceae bacterium]
MSRPQPRNLRASDADRERVVAVLAEATADGRLTLDEHTERVHRAYRARTLGELARLTEDLAAPSAQPLRLDGTRSVAAFFTTQRREGRWVMPDRLVATAVGGHIVLDLREALLQGLHTIVHATLIGGQLHLLVPQGVHVSVVGARQPGRPGSDVEPRPVAAGAPGSPVIEVRAVTVAGRVRVHTPRPAGRRLGWSRRRSR